MAIITWYMLLLFHIVCSVKHKKCFYGHIKKTQILQQLTNTYQGFRSNQHRGLSHLKAKYQNIKEEVLYNKFHSISVDNWNQTLRKCKVFNSSWIASTIRTLHNGEFNDQVLGKNIITWKKGEEIKLDEILTLKLYTDFDKLQFELKRCFRYESVDDTIQQYSKKRKDKRLSLISPSRDTFKYQLSAVHSDTEKDDHQFNHNNDDDDDDEKESKSDAKEDDNNDSNGNINYDTLEERLSQFHHWRGKLLIFVNKFGAMLSPTTINDKDKMLYHGINGKMILNPSETQSFFGPLSTTSSYHVAKSFATDKGMVLAISSQFPRLSMCRAFDASLISDYPEEQEFLIGFIYLRIRKIYTKDLKYIPVDSKLRFAFFAIHLFREQMFSMNSILERYLEAFLQIYLTKTKGVNKLSMEDMERLYHIKKKSTCALKLGIFFYTGAVWHYARSS